MKTSGVSCVPKFGLLVFLGHPIAYVDFVDDISDNYSWRKNIATWSKEKVCDLNLKRSCVTLGQYIFELISELFTTDLVEAGPVWVWQYLYIHKQLDDCGQ